VTNRCKHRSHSTADRRNDAAPQSSRRVINGTAAEISGRRARNACVAGYSASRRKKRSMINRLLSRKTKTIAFRGTIHLLPIFVRNCPGNLARDPFKVSPSRSLRCLSQTRISRFDLTLEVAIDRIGCRNRSLTRRLDYGHRSSAFRNGDAFSRFDPPEDPGRLVLQLAHAHLGFRSHVATNVATRVCPRQFSAFRIRVNNVRLPDEAAPWSCLTESSELGTGGRKLGGIDALAHRVVHRQVAIGVERHRPDAVVIGVRPGGGRIRDDAAGEVTGE